MIAQQQHSTADQSTNSSPSSSSSRLNAGAPEFVPRSTPPRLVFHHADPDHLNGLSDDARNKILNQVEYYFSDVNLATTDHLIKFITKDPDGYVPISVVASFKKIKALVASPQQLATLLRKSSKLAVSDDGKKVKRQIPLTEPDMEELQSRIVLAENLPEDHSYQNLMRVFSCVGSVKTIRTCQPQNASANANANAGTPRSKLDNTFLSNKLHAFVEYESVEIAEKAVTELNDERNWRSGLKVRLMPKRSMSKSTSNSQGGRGRKFGEGNGEEDDLSTSEQMHEKHVDDHLSPAAATTTTTDVSIHEHTTSPTSVDDKEASGRRGRGGRGGNNVNGGRSGKGRGRSQHHNSRGNHNNVIGTPLTGNNSEHLHSHLNAKQPPGPRMPDGTRGFALGRGKPLVSSTSSIV
ncbi:hypothetical protein ACHQM5_028558 [Ranunculus cassubicifolius]